MNVFEFLDYRIFLKEYCAAQLQVNPIFSYRYISMKAGIKSTGYLSMIIKGKRNLTDTNALSISKVLKMNKKEAAYFLTLVHFNQAKTIEEKTLLFQEINSQRRNPVMTVTKDQYEFYGKWYYSAIRELTEIYPVSDNWNDIAKQLCPAIKPFEAQKAIEVLTRLGLVEKGADGFYHRYNPVITSGKPERNFIIQQYQIQNLDIAKSAYDRFEKDERELSTVTMCIDTQTCQIIRERLAQVRSEILELARQVTKPSLVYQLNMQLFPMSKKIDNSINHEKV